MQTLPRPRVIKKVKMGIDDYILIDRDDPRPELCDSVTLYKMLGIMGIKAEWVRFDRTNRGWHIIICPSDEFRFQSYGFADAQGWLHRSRILLAQSILGDDPLRAAFNWRRMNNGIWLNQLFEPTPCR